MKRWVIMLGLLAGLCSNASALEWLTDVRAAQERAKQEEKVVLLDFTGSDWCPWCQKLKAEVFDQAEFATYAAANLVLVEVDFPRRKPQSGEQLEANRALAAKYHISGLPTVVLLSSEGQVLGECGYNPGGLSAFVAQLEYIRTTPQRRDTARVAPASGPRPAVAAPKPKPTLNVLVAPPPLKYGELTLKGISGAGTRRMALINNESLMTGESAKVKTFSTNVVVTVKEIRDSSVVVVVQGQTRELSLPHSPEKR